MNRAAVALVVLCVLAAAGWAFAQGPFKVPEPFNVLSGPNIGFRVERTEGNRAFGRLMVRVDGKWLEAQAADSHRMIPLKAK